MRAIFSTALLAALLCLPVGPLVSAARAQSSGGSDPAGADAAQAESEARVEAAEDTAQAEVLPPLTQDELLQLGKKRGKLRMTSPETPRFKRYLRAASKKMEDSDYPGAKELLERLNVSRLNKVELGNYYRLLGFLTYQLGDAPGALSYFRKAVDEESLPLRDQVNLMFSIVQLEAATENWPGVISSMDEWARFTPPSPLSFYLRAIAHYQMDQPELALENVEMAVFLEPEPPESWLQLLAALYVMKEDYLSVTPILEELVVRFPKKTYWVQLSLIYGASEDYDGSLSVQQLAFLQGFLTEDRELRRLARSYVFAGLPYEAATLLDAGLSDEKIEPTPKVYELLANSWIQAREFDRSMKPLEKAAALSDDGNLYLRLGQVYMAREDWSNAAKYFKQAVAKSGLKAPGSADLLLGIVYYNEDDTGEALKWFRRAKKYETTRKTANDWMDHIAKETQSS